MLAILKSLVRCGHAAKAAPVPAENPVAAGVASILAIAVTARQFPASTDWASCRHELPGVTYPVLYRGNLMSYTERPLHRLMSATHPFTNAAIAEACWASADFRRCVAHVFAEVQPAAVLAAAARFDGHGYWQPMVDLIRKAAASGLIGTNNTRAGV